MSVLSATVEGFVESLGGEDGALLPLHHSTPTFHNAAELDSLLKKFGKVFAFVASFHQPQWSSHQSAGLVSWKPKGLACECKAPSELCLLFW